MMERKPQYDLTYVEKQESPPTNIKLTLLFYHLFSSPSNSRANKTQKMEEIRSANPL